MRSAPRLVEEEENSVLVLPLVAFITLLGGLALL